MRTRIFQTGHSQAVCIPRELAFADDGIEVEIDRVGSTLVLRPSQPRTLADLGELLSMFSPHFMANGRDPGGGHREGSHAAILATAWCRFRRRTIGAVKLGRAAAAAKTRRA